MQFMAIAVLEAGLSPVKHAIEHDLESFVWVLAYSVLRKLARMAHSETEEIQTRIQSELVNSFGKITVGEILT